MDRRGTATAIPARFLEIVTWSRRRCLGPRKSSRRFPVHGGPGDCGTRSRAWFPRLAGANCRDGCRAHGSELKDALAFTRDERPCDTTTSRALAGLGLNEFRQTFVRWLKTVLADHEGRWGAAVDGKTSAAEASMRTHRPCKSAMFFCSESS